MHWVATVTVHQPQPLGEEKRKLLYDLNFEIIVVLLNIFAIIIVSDLL